MSTTAPQAGQYTSTSNGNPDGEQQRDQLEQSERRAQPDNFKDEAITDKVVEFEPGADGIAPIDGLDPENERDRGHRQP